MKAIQKEFWMEVRKSKARFLSMFFIVALGVAFFSGIQASAPDMRYSGDKYFDDSVLMDLKIIGTLGLTEEDIKEIKKIEGIEDAEGAYFTDAICKSKDAETVLHMESLNEKMNFLDVKEGNVPVKSGEIFLDSEYAFSQGYEVGDSLTLEHEEDGILKCTKYIVSGIGNSPLYISLSRGNTTLGSGEVSGFAYILPEDFDQEVYLQIYVKVHGAEDVTSYTDAYDDLVERLQEKVEGIEAERCQARYDSVVGEAQDKLADARKELEDGKREAEQELADAKKELDDGEKELTDGKKELEDGKQELLDGKKEIADGRTELLDAKKEIANGRTELENGKAELNSGRNQLESAKAELVSGRQQLNAAKTELNQGWTEVNAQEEQLNQGMSQLEAGKQQLNRGKEELNASKAMLQEKQTQLEQKKAELDAGEAELVRTEAQLNTQKEQCEEGLAQIGTGEEQLEAGEAELNNARLQLQELQTQITNLRNQKAQLETYYQELSEVEETSEEELASVMEQITTISAQLEQLEAQEAIAQQTINEQTVALEAQKAQLTQKRNELETSLSQIKAGLKEIARKKEEIKAGKAQLTAGQQEIASGWSQIEQEEENIRTAEAELAANERTLNEGRSQLESAKQQLQEGQRQIEENEYQLSQAEAQIQASEQTIRNGEQEIYANEQRLNEAEQEIAINERKLSDGEKELKDAEKEIKKAEKELADGEKELKDGKKEYEKAKADVEKELSDAEKEIADAEKEIEDIKVPEWMISDRHGLPEYSDYGDNADRIRNIGKVFPVIFFLVAALISLTTMTRMVEEQRTQIGTLKALGYSKFSIAAKYLAYAFLATAGGSILGVLVGEKIIPYIIIKAYGIMYKGMAANVVMNYEFKYAMIASIAAICCTIGATLFSCYKVLMELPASLMRPPAPKSGKRVLIERIPFIWKHLNFTWKSTMRNMFRYKKRFFMTIFGISGSMALMLVGFGLQDSIMDIVLKQYSELQHYDGMIIKDDEADEKEEEELQKYLAAEKRIQRYMNVQLSSMEVQKGKSQISVYVYVPEKPQEISEDVTLRDRKTKAAVEFNENGAIISEKTASLLNKKIGDTLVIRKDHQEYSVPIEGITENYMGHYIYMAPSLYEAVFKEEPEYTTVVFTSQEDQKDKTEEIGNEILGTCDAVLSISYISSLEEQLDRMLSTLSSVIVVLIVSAGMLAFVVLYNLNNINITERQRELATLKVLGFHDKEVSAYVFRENILLTAFGIVIGAVFGMFLHQFIIVTVEVETVMFGREIKNISYLYGALFTAGFSMFVNIVMHFKLKKINMVESLKSVE